MLTRPVGGTTIATTPDGPIMADRDGTRCRFLFQGLWIEYDEKSLKQPVIDEFPAKLTPFDKVLLRSRW